MMLPYWNSELDLEIAPWFPLGVDYRPVSPLGGLSRLAAACLSLGSELLLVASPRLGSAGSLARDSLCRPWPPRVINLGFMMLLGWSAAMEDAVAGALPEGLAAGVTRCSLWAGGVLSGSLKVIAVVSEAPFFDEGDEDSGFLHDFAGSLPPPGAEPFFAEAFGYRRFSMPFDEPPEAARRLREMELDATRAVLGPPPEIPFPPFVGAVSVFC